MCIHNHKCGQNQDTSIHTNMPFGSTCTPYTQAFINLTFDGVFKIMFRLLYGLTHLKISNSILLDQTPATAQLAAFKSLGI